MKNKIKKIVNNFLSKFDLKIVRLSNNAPFDLTSKNLDPISLQYIFGYNQMIVNIDLARGRTNRWFELSDKSLDPPIFAIRSALKKGLNGDALRKDIFSVYQKYMSTQSFEYSVADFLDVESIYSKNLKDYPFWAEVKPWDNRTLDNMVRHHPNEVKKDRAKHGKYFLSDDPHKIMKDDFENLAYSHSIQYAKLIEQIKNDGFKYGGDYGYVNAEIFIANNMMRWKPGGDGNHRVAVASALGFKYIPVLVTKIIRLDEIEYWPNVINGSFNKDQATKIFYNIFNAKPKKIDNDWIKTNYFQSFKKI
tara:strand:- start:1067 stop:1984 length:918 start_codon:yes stop_codon:yes gene_type:complete